MQCIFRKGRPCAVVPCFIFLLSENCVIQSLTHRERCQGKVTNGKITHAPDSETVRGVFQFLSFLLIQQTARCSVLYNTLREHSFCNLEEACNVCTCDEVVFVCTVLLCSSLTVIVDSNHNAVKLFVNFLF